MLWKHHIDKTCCEQPLHVACSHAGQLVPLPAFSVPLVHSVISPFSVTSFPVSLSVTLPLAAPVPVSFAVSVPVTVIPPPVIILALPLPLPIALISPAPTIPAAAAWAVAALPLASLLTPVPVPSVPAPASAATPAGLLMPSCSVFARIVIFITLLLAGGGDVLVRGGCGLAVSLLDDCCCQGVLRPQASARCACRHGPWLCSHMH
mmetsp:Transcript_18666/g.40113  ORF Transcript_18666/g.40113 Transcript_18666/m.40113 type:complete len:206 (-) Transcript_18666:993-1610(-)